MKRKMTVLLAIIMCITVLIAPNVQARTLTSNETGNHGGYDYEYWKDSGNGTMVLKDGGTFSCQWSNINNILFRKGRKYDETKTHQQLGNIVVEYGADFRPNGNSYLCVYGWTVDPLVEYYIIESWGDWRPPGAQSKGKITVDGGTYDVYETTRVNQPSIKGTATFQQYWSVRTSKKTSGTISVSQHFRAWENMGMKMGKMYEVATTVEGYQSSGSADVYKNDIKVGGSIPNDPVDPVDPGDPGGSTMPENNGPNSRDAFSTIEAEEYNAYSSSTMEIIGTGSGEGIGYIENGDSLTFKNVNFGSGATKFTANVASDVENPTTIDIRLGSSTGTRIGTLEVGSTGGWNDYTELSTNISSVTGENDIVLVFSGAVNIDWFTFTKGSGGTNPTTPPTHNPNVKYGDVNDDGVVNSMDASLLSRYVLEIIDSLPNIDAADLNGDKTINSMDSTLLSRYILEVIDKFPVEDMVPVPTQTPEPTEKPVPKEVKIMPLGDSITDGFNVPGGYRIKLWNNIVSNGYKVDFVGSQTNGPAELPDKDHEGYSGWRTGQISERINGWMDAAKPDIVLLHIGTNDVTAGNTSPNELGALIDKICAKLPPGGKLYVAQIIPLSFRDVRPLNQYLVSVVNSKASAGLPVYLVDMYSPLTLNDLADGIHPSRTGYNKMADVWFEAIRDDLSK